LAWLGLAWLGLAWLGLAWLGLAWLGLAWLGLAWRFHIAKNAEWSNLCNPNPAIKQVFEWPSVTDRNKFRLAQEWRK
jgi:hypothetical protein